MEPDIFLSANTNPAVRMDVCPRFREHSAHAASRRFMRVGENTGRPVLPIFISLSSCCSAVLNRLSLILK